MKKKSLLSLFSVILVLGVSVAGTFYTSWNDVDNPSGVGDYELFTNPCSSGSSLLAVEVQTVPATGNSFVFSGSIYNGMVFGKNVSILGPMFTGSDQRGVQCVNSANSSGCIDYQVRFLCYTVDAPLQTGRLIVTNANTSTGIYAYRNTGAVLHKFNLMASGITINTSNITILYSGSIISGSLTNFSNMIANYYSGTSLISTGGCVWSGGMFNCSSNLLIPSGVTRNVQIRANIPSYATGISILTTSSIVAKNQSGVSQQVIGLPVSSPMIYIR